jgi:hypothetical protein
VFLWYKNTSERKLQPEGPTPGRKVVRLLTLARRNPACCDVDKMPSPNFILTPSKDALGSYRELNPSNFLCVSVLIPKKHLSSILQGSVSILGAAESCIMYTEPLHILRWFNGAKAFLTE